MFTKEKRKWWILWIITTSRIRLLAIWAHIFFVSVIIEKGFWSNIFRNKFSSFKGVDGTNGGWTWITTEGRWSITPLFFFPYPPLFCVLAPLRICGRSLPRVTMATFDLLLFFPAWEGGGALLPRSTVASLPWAGGGEDCAPAQHWLRWINSSSPPPS